MAVQREGFHRTEEAKERMRAAYAARMVKGGKPTADDRRQKICAFVARFWDEIGYAPSLQEISRAVGIPKRGEAVLYHLRMLERDGYILRDERIARSIRLTEAGRRLAGVRAHTQEGDA